MANLAPYKLWSIGALKNEAIQRGGNKDAIAKLSKDKIVEMLEKSDSERKAGKKSKEPAKPEKKAKKEAVPEKKAKKEAVPEKKAKEKKEKKEKLSSQWLNDQLRKKGLWIKGMQLWKKETRKEFLDGDDKLRKKMTKQLTELTESTRAKLSNTMTKVMKQRKKDGLPIGAPRKNKDAEEAKPEKKAKKEAVPEKKAKKEAVPEKKAKKQAKPEKKKVKKSKSSDAAEDLFND